MRRGAVVLAAGPGEYSGKPRPFVVVQSDLFDAHDSVSLCPVTSVLTGNLLFRVALPASDATGLTRESEVQVDKVQSLRRSRLVRQLGVVSTDAMTQLDQALRRWLAL